MIEEFDIVALTTDIPEHALKSGDMAVLVDFQVDRETVWLEVFDMDNNTIDVIATKKANIREIKSYDVKTVREYDSNRSIGSAMPHNEPIPTK